MADKIKYEVHGHITHILDMDIYHNKINPRVFCYPNFQVCYLKKEFSLRTLPDIAGDLYAREETFRNYNNSLVRSHTLGDPQKFSGGGGERGGQTREITQKGNPILLKIPNIHFLKAGYGWGEVLLLYTLQTHSLIEIRSVRLT